MSTRVVHPVDVLNRHAPAASSGFDRDDIHFLAFRRQRSALVQRFLAIMAHAGNPGLRRNLGSTVRQLTGQHSDHYWITVLKDQHGHHREFLVFADGRHGWGDEISYSDRPRSSDDEIAPRLLRRVLGGVLVQYGLDWGSSPADLMPFAQPAGFVPALTAQQELHRRQVRYGVLMGIRIVCLLMAAIIVILDVPNMQLWVLACIGAAMVLPWVAVMVANEHFRSSRLRT